MHLLRNLGETTQLLILLETALRHHAVQRTIADALGMTVQGVSEYLRAMERDGLVQVVDGEYRPTIEGVRVLHERFRGLRDFVDRASKGLSIIDVTAAIAGNEVAEPRSEEHTSELQSRSDLVCRLLLEKKKTDAEPRYR